MEYFSENGWQNIHPKKDKFYGSCPHIKWLTSKNCLSEDLTTSSHDDECCRVSSVPCDRPHGGQVRRWTQPYRLSIYRGRLQHDIEFNWKGGKLKFWIRKRHLVSRPYEPGMARYSNIFGEKIPRDIDNAQCCPYSHIFPFVWHLSLTSCVALLSNVYLYWPCFNIKALSSDKGISVIKKGWSSGRLNFIMGISILARRHFNIETLSFPTVSAIVNNVFHRNLLYSWFGITCSNSCLHINLMFE